MRRIDYLDLTNACIDPRRTLQSFLLSIESGCFEKNIPINQVCLYINKDTLLHTLEHPLYYNGYDRGVFEDMIGGLRYKIFETHFKKTICVFYKGVMFGSLLFEED